MQLIDNLNYQTVPINYFIKLFSTQFAYNNPNRHSWRHLTALSSSSWSRCARCCRPLSTHAICRQTADAGDILQAAGNISQLLFNIRLTCAWSGSCYCCRRRCCCCNSLCATFRVGKNNKEQMFRLLFWEILLLWQKISLSQHTSTRAQSKREREKDIKRGGESRANDKSCFIYSFSFCVVTPRTWITLAKIAELFRTFSTLLLIYYVNRFRGVNWRNEAAKRGELWRIVASFALRANLLLEFEKYWIISQSLCHSLHRRFRLEIGGQIEPWSGTIDSKRIEMKMCLSSSVRNGSVLSVCTIFPTLHFTGGRSQIAYTTRMYNYK